MGANASVYLQEFCLFAVVGLVSDFFLQMLFFTTVLSIDIRRMEVGTEHGPAGGRGEHSPSVPLPEEKKNRARNSLRLGKPLRSRCPAIPQYHHCAHC